MQFSHAHSEWWSTQTVDQCSDPHVQQSELRVAEDSSSSGWRSSQGRSSLSHLGLRTQSSQRTHIAIAKGPKDLVTFVSGNIELEAMIHEETSPCSWEPLSEELAGPAQCSCPRPHGDVSVTSLPAVCWRITFWRRIRRRNRVRVLCERVAILHVSLVSACRSTLVTCRPRYRPLTGGRRLRTLVTIRENWKVQLHPYVQFHQEHKVHVSL
mmetsp:Transcript_50800/g.135533  ORF Transcript_50800/g.135533 Transcript_50800/m.135533 type:complete len:211 (+) Transcript_50800:93-725(+)